MSGRRSRPRRWLSALKLAVLALGMGLGLAVGVAASLMAAVAWLEVQGGDGFQRARLERLADWVGGLELVGVVVLGSVVGLAWSRATSSRGARR